ncbi:MAG: alpha/beta fold hydrolase [Bdellovibrionota bacterium]
MRKRLFILLGAGFGLSSCAHHSFPFREPQSEVAPNTVWNGIISRVAVSKLQEPCVPRRIVPPHGVAIRGKVIMIHGFTACPQQYFELSERLAAEGWISYLLLLPGHGRVKRAGGIDDSDSFPGHGLIAPYDALANDVVALARADSLPTTVVGLSVGGAVALDAVLKAPADFDRALLISPFFAANDNFLRTFGLPVLGRVPLTDNHRIAWGPVCLDEMKRGRGGDCSFKLHQLSTVQAYGKKVSNKSHSVSTKIQIIGVEEDGAASTSWIRRTAKKLGIGKSSSDASACFYPEGANHSLLSRFDHPDENKYWLSSLLKSATAFIDQGRRFEAAPATSDKIPGCRF